MTDDHKLNAEAGRYDFGMGAILAAWRHRSQQWTAAAMGAQGLTDSRFYPLARSPITAGGYGVVTGPVDTPIQPGTGSIGLEGQQPGVVEQQRPVSPELLIPAAIVVVGDKVAEGRLIEAVALPWFEVLKELDRDPDFLHKLDSRQMEELIAGAYKREGWDEVILTPQSGDRGRDIIATKHGLGSIRFYDQVKAYSPGHRVPANDVRALLGVLTLHQNVSKAVITTTAQFAPGVHDEFKPVIPYRLELKDGPRLREWLMGLGPQPPPASR